MSLQKIPISSEPNQSFKSTVTVDGINITLQFALHYNDVAGYWVMGITDPLTGLMLVDSLPLLPGPSNGPNLLSQHAHLRIGSMYLYNAGNVAVEYPTDKNMGTDFILLWGDNPNG